MTDDSKATVPVWTLATGDVWVPAVSIDETMTAERLTDRAAQCAGSFG